MKQKFKKLSFIHVCKELPDDMSHFENDFDGIVCGTYSQEYGGGNIKDYCVYKLENGKIVDQIAWYDESQITLSDHQDRDKAEEMIEKYNLGDEDGDLNYSGNDSSGTEANAEPSRAGTGNPIISQPPSSAGPVHGVVGHAGILTSSIKRGNHGV